MSFYSFINKCTMNWGYDIGENLLHHKCNDFADVLAQSAYKCNDSKLVPSVWRDLFRYCNDGWKEKYLYIYL